MRIGRWQRQLFISPDFDIEVLLVAGGVRTDYRKPMLPACVVSDVGTLEALAVFGGV
jgi:hypothetical protein